MAEIWGTQRNPCQSIQLAVDQTTTSRQTISIDQGQYDEQIRIDNREVRLIGFDNPTLTFSGDGEQFYCEGTNVCFMDIVDDSIVLLDSLDIIIRDF